MMDVISDAILDRHFSIESKSNKNDSKSWVFATDLQ